MLVHVHQENSQSHNVIVFHSLIEPLVKCATNSDLHLLRFMGHG